MSKEIGFKCENGDQVPDANGDTPECVDYEVQLCCFGNFIAKYVIVLKKHNFYNGFVIETRYK